jgi:hypothetical protein
VLAAHQGGERVFVEKGTPLVLVVVLLPSFIGAIWPWWTVLFALQWSRMKPLVGTLVLERTSASPPGLVARVNGSIEGPTRQAAVLDVDDSTDLRGVVLVVGSRVITLSHFVNTKDSVYPERTQWKETVAALREGGRGAEPDLPAGERPRGSAVPLVRALMRVLDQGPTLPSYLKEARPLSRSLLAVGAMFACVGARIAESYWLDHHAELFAPLGVVVGGVMFGAVASLAELVVLSAFVRVLYADHYDRLADGLLALASYVRAHH